MIKANQLYKRYGSITAVNNLSFHIKKGEICGFLGPNGAGKTSTMRILAGYMPPTEGSAEVAGYNVYSHPLEVKKRVGYLPESTPLYTDMRVKEYLNFAAEVKGLSKSEKTKAVSDAMEMTLVGHRSRSLIGNLSKGLKQRVGIAQALLHDPEILILDEPTIGLDPKQISDIRTLIQDLAGKRTVILSSHILPEVQAICSKVMIINDGTLLAADTPQNLGEKFQEKGVVTVKIGGPSADVLVALKNLPQAGVVSIAESGDAATTYTVSQGAEEGLAKAIVGLIAQKGWELFSFSESSLSLEEVYIKLVAGAKKADTEEDESS